MAIYCIDFRCLVLRGFDLVEGVSRMSMETLPSQL